MRTPFVQRRKWSWRASCGLILLLLGMFFFWAYSGVLWHSLTGLPFLIALLWVFRPPSLLLRALHAVALVVIGLVGCIFLGQWLRYYVVQVYHVPTSSMERTILPGDRVLVYKTGHHQGRSSFFAQHASGVLTGVQRGDVVAFFRSDTLQDALETSGKPYIKRCVALPGDEIQLAGSVLYVNGLAELPPTQAIYRFQFEFADSATMFAVGASLPFPVHYAPSRPMFGCYISQARADSLGRDVRVQSYYRSFNRHSAPAEVFPHSERFAWNTNIFGPLRVPAHGDSILLTPDRATLYHSVMLEEGHQVEIRGDSVLVDGSPESYYVFAGDYYFMMGDNRMNSRDSRIFGFVPRDHIIGVVPVVLYSVSRDHSGAGSGFRWNRIFRSVR